MTDEQKNKYIDIMTENLTMLRAKLDLTQEELANVVGLSRYTVISIEKRQRRMTWNTFLSMLLIFSKNEDTSKIIEVIGLGSSELLEFLNIDDLTKK